ncbi:hypothetical protein [Aliiroseovarius sp. YM-037]|uniref:hypothetical protein n=1 Tax=Aliiroseovarius sp. YM-037 TaxID=3341728 RepID=UPI003A803A3F
MKILAATAMAISLLGSVPAQADNAHLDRSVAQALREHRIDVDVSTLTTHQKVEIYLLANSKKGDTGTRVQMMSALGQGLFSRVLR